MQSVLYSLKRINYRLFWALMLLAIMPAIYITVRVHLLGNFPDTWGFNIASQMQWIHLLYEVMQEALILPLFFIMGLSLKNKAALENKVRSGLFVTLLIYVILSMFVIYFARPLVVFMAQQEDLIEATIDFVRLETVASIFMTMVKFITLVLITIGKSRYLYIILATKMLMTIVLDVFFISQASFSLNLGVNGIAYSNMIVNAAIFIMAVVVLYHHGIRIFSLKRFEFTWMRQWFRVGLFSGLESLTRNLAFMLMIVRLMNVVQEQGTFWTGNQFIWSWLLLPILTLGDLIKKEIAEDKQNIQENTLGYFVITSIILLLWFITMPLWPAFLRDVMNLGNYTTVFYLVMIQLFFYIIFAYNNILDSTFYGVGKTHYLFYQSIVVNIFFYGGAFILYRMGIFIPTLTSVALLFGLGIFADFIPTLILYRKLLKDENLTLYPKKV